MDYPVKKYRVINAQKRNVNMDELLVVGEDS